MNGDILGLLDRHGSLALDQIAAKLQDRPDAVRRELELLRDHGLVAVVAVGRLEGHTTRAMSYWLLTEEGRKHLVDGAEPGRA